MHFDGVIGCVCVTPPDLSPGVLGIKVKIMLPHDPTGKSGPKKPLPDHVSPIITKHT